MLFARPRKNISAIIEAPKGGFWLIEQTKQKASYLDENNNLIKFFEDNQIILIDAKNFLQKYGITYRLNYNILCLSTVKRLVSKKNNDEIVVPAFSNPNEALFWLSPIIDWINERLQKLNLEKLCALECRVVGATLAMQEQGLSFRKALWENTLLTIKEKTQQLKEQLAHLLKKSGGFELFGPEPVDINNAQEVKKALEEVLGCRLSSTSQSALKDNDHPAVKLLLSYRENARMLSTYGDTFLSKIKDDRLKGSFIPIGSASGRFACHDPNLLALPNQASFQACLKPYPPQTVIHLDYGGFELRILAALSKDPELSKIFNDELDIHSVVAEAVFKTKVSKTENSHLREHAKLINFGIIYGMSEQALAKQLKISLSEAENLLRNYFKRFSRVHAYLKYLEESARKFGYAKTVLNRRAYFSSTDAGYFSRVVRNIPIQGSGADIIKLAMVKVFEHFYESTSSAHLVNVVHDELVIECHQEESAQVSEIVKGHMESAFVSVFKNVRPEVSIK